MMHPMQTPEQGHSMEQYMLKINGKVEGHDRNCDRDPYRKGESVQQPPAVLFTQQRNPYRGYWKQDSKHQCIQRRDPQITWPPLNPFKAPLASRRQRFPDSDSKEDCREKP